MTASDSNILRHLKKIQEIQKKSDPRERILDDMRTIHGRAILDNHLLNHKLISKPGSCTRDELVQVSVNASILCDIQYLISRFEENSGAEKLRPSPVKRSAPTNREISSSSNVYPVIKKDNNDVETISIKGMDTEYGPTGSETQEKFELFMPNVPTKMTGGAFPEDEEAIRISDFIENLTTGRARDLLSSDAYYPPRERVNQARSRESNLSYDKPTLVYFYSNGCGFCQAFKNTWQRFKSSSHTALPGVQVVEADVDNQGVLNSIRELGFNGVPKIVFFNKGKYYPQTATGMQVNEIVDYVRKLL